MLSIDIKMNFENQDPIELTTSWYMSTLKDWNLSSRGLVNKYDFKCSMMSWTYKMPAKEFLELVGHNEDEAIEIILKNNIKMKEDEAKEHITYEVEQFYRELETTKLISVDFELVDQS